MPKPNLKKKRSLLALLLVALLLISGIPTPIFATENEIGESTAEVTTIAETADTDAETAEATLSSQEATEATEKVTPSESIPETMDTAPPEAESSPEDNHPLASVTPNEENTETLPLSDLDEEKQARLRWLSRHEAAHRIIQPAFPSILDQLGRIIFQDTASPIFG